MRARCDPHPLCPKCRRRHGIRECTPDTACSWCKDLSLNDWAEIFASRKRRLWKRSMSATKSTTPRPPLDDGGDRDLQSPVNPPPPIFDSLPEDMVHSQQEQELFTEAIRSRPAHRVSIQQVYSDSDDWEDGVPATQNVRSTRSLSRSRSASPRAKMI